MEPGPTRALRHNQQGSGVWVPCIGIQQDVDEPVGPVEEGVADNALTSKVLGLKSGVLHGVEEERGESVAADDVAAQVHDSFPADQLIEFAEHLGEEHVVVVSGMVEVVLSSGFGTESLAVDGRLLGGILLLISPFHFLPLFLLWPKRLTVAGVQSLEHRRDRNGSHRDLGHVEASVILAVV